MTHTFYITLCYAFATLILGGFCLKTLMAYMKAKTKQPRRPWHLMLGVIGLTSTFVFHTVAAKPWEASGKTGTTTLIDGHYDTSMNTPDPEVVAELERQQAQAAAAILPSASLSEVPPLAPYDNQDLETDDPVADAPDIEDTTNDAGNENDGTNLLSDDTGTATNNVAIAEDASETDDALNANSDEAEDAPLLDEAVN